MNRNTISWILRIIVAVVLLQTLFFKFSAAPESVYIFEQVDMEPLGRIGVGVAELIASILILYPRTVRLGAAMGVMLMLGALYFHISILGIEVMDDGGTLFTMALVVFLCSLAVLFMPIKKKPKPEFMPE
jgi:putative oxidoreductase